MFALCRPEHHGSTPKETSQKFDRIEWHYFRFEPTQDVGHDMTRHDMKISTRVDVCHFCQTTLAFFYAVLSRSIKIEMHFFVIFSKDIEKVPTFKGELPKWSLKVTQGHKEKRGLIPRLLVQPLQRHILVETSNFRYSTSLWYAAVMVILSEYRNRVACDRQPGVPTDRMISCYSIMCAMHMRCAVKISHITVKLFESKC